MSIKYDIPETVWNRYVIGNIEKEDLEKLFKKENTRDIWQIQGLYPERHISVEMEESCFSFIDSDYEKAELDYDL